MWLWEEQLIGRESRSTEIWGQREGRVGNRKRMIGELGQKDKTTVRDRKNR